MFSYSISCKQELGLLAGTCSAYRNLARLRALVPLAETWPAYGHLFRLQELGLLAGNCSAYRNLARLRELAPLTGTWPACGNLFCLRELAPFPSLPHPHMEGNSAAKDSPAISFRVPSFRNCFLIFYSSSRTSAPIQGSKFL